MVTAMRLLQPVPGTAADANNLVYDQRVFVVGSVVGGANYVRLNTIRG